MVNLTEDSRTNIKLKRKVIILRKLDTKIDNDLKTEIRLLQKLLREKTRQKEAKSPVTTHETESEKEKNKQLRKCAERNKKNENIRRVKKQMLSLLFY